jgi:hypothetical protein
MSRTISVSACIKQLSEESLPAKYEIVHLAIHGAETCQVSHPFQRRQGLRESHRCGARNREGNGAPRLVPLDQYRP